MPGGSSREHTDMQKIFEFLTKTEEQALLNKGGVLRFSPESTIVRESDVHGAIYIISEGEVRVEKASHGFPLEIARLGTGQIFGEMSFIDGSPASADIVANDFVETYVIDKKLMEPLLKAYPSIYGRFFHSLAAILAGRLRSTSAKFSSEDDKLTWSPELDTRGLLEPTRKRGF